MQLLHPACHVRRPFAHQFAGRGVAVQVGVERPDQAEIRDRRLAAQQGRVLGEMGVQLGEQVLVGGLHRGHHVLGGAQQGGRLGERHRQFLADGQLVFRGLIGGVHGAEFRHRPVAVVEPPVMHGRNHQPLVPVGFQHQRHQLAQRRGRVQRRAVVGSRLFQGFDDHRAVLEDATVPIAQHRDHRRAHRRHDHLAVDVGGGEYLLERYRGPAQVGADFSGEVTDFGPVQRGGHGLVPGSVFGGQEKTPHEAGFFPVVEVVLFADDVRGLRSLGTLLNVESDFLTFRQSAEARAVDRAEMHEHIRATVILGNKAETLGFVEPFHGTSSH